MPSKIKVFAWLAILGRVNTNDQIQRKRPFASLSPSWCILCKRDGENIDHVLLQCSFVRKLWDKVFELFNIVGAVPHKWADFVIVKWHFNNYNKKISCLWRFAIMAAAWSVWLERNKRIFEDKSSLAEDIWC